MKNIINARRLAQKYGWTEVYHKEMNGLIRFKKDKNTFIDYWYTTDTVGTVVNHPKKGRNQLFRRKIGKGLEKVFMNPRVHTGIGYYYKN